jgi:peptidoglycan/LPS O-acetylase OafA/YrhL
MTTLQSWRTLAQRRFHFMLQLMNRVPGLDFLRAIAIAWVMYYHGLVLGLVAETDPVATYGWMGVDLFFALSGYLIGGQLFRPIARDQPYDAGSFYARRLFRTLPAYLVVVALYFTVPVFRERQEIQPLWQFLTFTENLFIDVFHAKAFSHVWSLCVEEQFYLVAPLVVWIVARRPSARKVIAVCAVVLIGGMALRGYVWMHDLAPAQAVTEGRGRFSQLFMERIYYPTWMRLDGLLFGMAFAMVRTFRPATWAWLMRRGDWLLAAAAVGLGVSFWLFRDQRAFLPTVIGYPILSAAMACLVAAGASATSLVGRLRIPGAGALAAMAYSLYLTHKQVYHMMKLVVGARLDGAPVVAFAVFGGAALLAGAALYLLVERPFLKLRDRILDRPSAEPMPAAPEQAAA